MRISFYCNYLITRFSVLRGTRALPEPYNALIDTASEKSALPLADCMSLGLAYAGDYELMTASGRRIFSTFDAKVDLDGRVFEIQVMGIPERLAVLGLDVLHHYKITIDWSTNPKQVIVEDRP